MKPWILALLCAVATACNTEPGPEYTTLARFGEVTIAPSENITPDDVVTVTVPVESEYGLQQVVINYATEEETTGSLVSPVYYGKSNTKVTYKGTIPRQENGTKVSFIVMAVTPYRMISYTPVKSYTVVYPTPDPEPAPDEK